MADVNKLANLNLAAGFLHASLGIGLTAWAAAKFDNSINSVDTSTYIVNPTDYVVDVDDDVDVDDHDDSFEQAGQKINVGVKRVIPTDTSSIIIMVLLFTFITAIFHFVVYGLRKSLYTEMVNKENNWLRWCEYSITATLMIILISISLGTKDFQTILLTAFSNLAVMMLGQVVEKMISEKRFKEAILTTVVAWLLFTSIWAVLTQTFANIISNGADVPDFVWAIFILMFIFFSCFGFVQLLQLCGVFKSYFQVEISYVSLSFISKFLLALLIFWGVLARQDITPES
jgi:hypothetical protein